jgi:hypothetical protein
MVYQPRTDEGTPLDSAIAEMDVIAEEYKDAMPYIDIVKASLVRVRERHEAREISTLDASFALFNIYWHNQSQAQHYAPMAHILRVVGDDLGCQLGEDFDELWELWEKSSELHS